jgi:hypothetical protein
VINPVRFRAVAIRCTPHRVGAGEFGPGEALHADVDVTAVHTPVRFWVRPSKHVSLSVPQEV